MSQNKNRLYDCPNCGTIDDPVIDDSSKGPFHTKRCPECHSRVYLQ